MEITLDFLLKGLGHTYKDATFLSTAEYVTPFINEMKKLTDKFVVKATQSPHTPVINGIQLLIFTKVWIQAKVGDVTYNMTYATDSRKPLYKFFKTYGKLHLIDRDSIIAGELKSGKTIPPVFMRLLNHQSDFSAKLDHLMVTKIQDRVKVLGDLVERCLTDKVTIADQDAKVSYTDIVGAYDEVVLRDGRYDILSLYQAITDRIWLGKDIYTVPDKLLVVANLF